jgi:hypothetical protein
MYALWLPTLLLSACTATQRPNADGGDYTPADTVAAKDLLALEPGKATYERTVNGRSSRVTVELTEGKDKTWTSQTEKVRTTTLVVDDGAIAVVRDIERDDDADVRYEPAILMLPAKLEQGKPVTAEAKMTVHDGDGDGIKARGTCRVKIELLGMRSVTTPAGEFECHVIRTTRTIRLDLAHVDVVIHAAYSPEHGLVRERIERHTKALGLFGGKSSEEMVLIER